MQNRAVKRQEGIDNTIITTTKTKQRVVWCGVVRCGVVSMFCYKCHLHIHNVFEKIARNYRIKTERKENEEKKKKRTTKMDFDFGRLMLVCLCHPFGSIFYGKRATPNNELKSFRSFSSTYSIKYNIRNEMKWMRTLYEFELKDRKLKRGNIRWHFRHFFTILYYVV